MKKGSVLDFTLDYKWVDKLALTYNRASQVIATTKPGNNPDGAKFLSATFAVNSLSVTIYKKDENSNEFYYG